MATQTVVPIKQKVANVRNLLEKCRDQLAMALPKHLDANRMIRIAMTSIQKTPKLLDCTQASLIGAVMQAAQLGLEPDGLLGQAYLVPYKTTATLIPGYKGLLKLARNSGEISTIYAHEVYAKDQFKFSYGLNECLEHTPTAEEDPGEVIAFYAVCKLKDGSHQFEVMWKRQVDTVRKRSRAANDGPWVTDFNEMGRKTVLRRLCKMLPSSVELASAIAIDERVEAGLPPDMDIIDITEDQTPAAPEAVPAVKAESKLDAIVSAAKAEKPKLSSKPLPNTNYAEGSDPDPFQDGGLFDREPGIEG